MGSLESQGHCAVWIARVDSPMFAVLRVCCKQGLWQPAHMRFALPECPRFPNANGASGQDTPTYRIAIPGAVEAAWIREENGVLRRPRFRVSSPESQDPMQSLMALGRPNPGSRDVRSVHRLHRSILMAKARSFKIRLTFRHAGVLRVGSCRQVGKFTFKSFLVLDLSSSQALPCSATS